MIEYDSLDIQELRDLCGSREVRYPTNEDKDGLVWLLEDADFWEDL